jgi:uncharacterized delta-60 repeat protein
MRMRGRLVGALAVLLLLVTAGPAAAAAGDLDPSFGDGGKATFPLSSPNGGAQDIAAQGSKIVAIGEVGGDFGLIRSTDKGELDPSFGAAGFSQVNVGGNDNGAAVAVGPDGNIYAAGTAGLSMPSRSYFALSRLDSNGNLDTAFAPPNGFMNSKFEALSASSTDIGFEVALQPDGNVLVGGYSVGPDPSAYDTAVSRVLNPSGTLDFGFGGDGGTSVHRSGYDAVNRIAVQPDGKIVLAGYALGDGALVTRLDPSGTPDASFGGGDGQVLLPGTKDGGAVAVQPDGKLVVAGDDGVDAVVERLLPNGAPDESFSGDGRATIDLGATDRSTDVILQPDGKVVIGGTAAAGAQSDYGAARLQPNGAPDTTFGNAGITRISIAPSDFATGTVLQPDGKVVLGGFSGPTTDPSPTGDFSMIRLQGDTGGSAKGKCAGKKATIIGTNGKDKLKGTKKKDVISAGGGKDTVKGLNGNDLICGGKGKDKLVGGPGKDKLLGQQGNDKLLGGPGKDKLLGQAGKDILRGGPGKDKVKGGPGKDVETP